MYAPGLQLETVMVYGTTFDEAFQRWGEVLMQYHGKVPITEDEDFTSNYLSKKLIQSQPFTLEMIYLKATGPTKQRSTTTTRCPGSTTRTP